MRTVKSSTARDFWSDSEALKTYYRSGSELPENGKLNLGIGYRLCIRR
jgi:hypothetical protein